MLDQLRDHLTRELAAHRMGVVSVSIGGAPWSVPVRYRTRGLAVEWLQPQWSELAQVADDHPAVMLVVPVDPDGRRWLQVRGQAAPVADPDWTGPLLSPPTGPLPPADLYRMLRLQPTRIDLFDESRGWGARETLDL